MRFLLKCVNVKKTKKGSTGFNNHFLRRRVDLDNTWKKIRSSVRHKIWFEGSCTFKKKNLKIVDLFRILYRLSPLPQLCHNLTKKSDVNIYGKCSNTIFYMLD